jgi:hypothetical protein
VPTSLSISNPTARLAAEHPGAVKAGRVGWAAKGVVYLLAGILAVVVALKAVGWSDSSSNQEASPTGAIKTIAATTGGSVLLWVLAVGMLLYAAWRVVSAVMPGSSGAESWVKRIGYLVSAVIYTTFAITAISLARSSHASADGNSKVTDLTARTMTHSAGRFVIGAIGVIAIGAGLYRLIKGLKRDVNDELDLSGMSAQRAQWTRRLGAIGEVGRGIAIGLIGFFLLRAAVTFDASQATGLDGALRRLAVTSWGQLLVAVIGVGFVAYGVFCLTTFTHRRLQAP